jgi:hypothetical protein
MTPDAISAQARQFKRHAARMAGRVEPHPEHADQFRLSFPDAFSELAIIDVSEGGFGFVANVMFPKNLRLLVRIEAVDQTKGRSFLVRGVIRRCIMLDHKPTFQIGVQFLNPTAPDESELIHLVLAAKKRDQQLAEVGIGVA